MQCSGIRLRGIIIYIDVQSPSGAEADSERCTHTVTTDVMDASVRLHKSHTKWVKYTVLQTLYTVISFFFVVKLFSYTENLRKYFTRK